ncbi:MAG: LemA family protein [Actinomycetota bacterium]
MGIWIVILLAVIVLVAIAAVVSYNRFVSQKTLIKDSWANIDTELRRRYDLIPNLVETVKGYASHEKEVLENVTRARAMAAGATGSPAEQAAAEAPLVAALRQLMLVVENYPDLKANQNFLELQGELTNTEDRLQTARRFYNANVRDYNRRVNQFPSMVVASMFNFEEEEFFEVEEGIREGGAPQVDFGSPKGSGAPLAGETPAAAPASDAPTSSSAPPSVGAPATPPPPDDDVPEPPGQPTPPNPTG